MLEVYSASIGYAKARLEDALDVTRASGVEGLFLAPSWGILSPALGALRRAKKMKHDAAMMPVELRANMEVEAHNIEAKTWAEYTFAYLGEMRASYRTNRKQWDALMMREMLVLCCYCVSQDKCHRMILRKTILPKLGAVDRGELLRICVPGKTL
jgi:uncharacterized protein YeaO (DUF488 family)